MNVFIALKGTHFVSLFAAGAYSVNYKDHIYQAFWSEEEAQKHSTYRKMKAVLLALDSFSDKLNNKNVKWFTDSKNCARILQSGSFKEDLHSVACQIYSLCASKGISLEIHWIPRSQNCQADFISKAFLMTGAFQMIFCIYELSRAMRKRVLCHMRTTKAQIRLRGCTV